MYKIHVNIYECIDMFILSRWNEHYGCYLISQTESVEYILITLNEKKKINKRLETVLIRIYR